MLTNFLEESKMPILGQNELDRLSPFFKTRTGRAIAGFLMRFTALDRLNDLYDSLGDKKGPDFAEALSRKVGVDYSVANAEALERLPEGAFITISNHPYGGWDGIALIDLLGHARRDFKVMVNKILTYIRTLEENFISVIPTGEKRGTPASESIRGVREALQHIRAGHPLGLFPSGAVSDLHIADGFSVRDRQWQEPAIRLIKKAHVPVIPIKFFDCNSIVYYLLGLINGNLRTLHLPREVMNKGGEQFRIAIGDIITEETQDKFENLDDFRDFLRSSVYDMPIPEKFIRRSEAGNAF